MGRSGDEALSPSRRNFATNSRRQPRRYQFDARPAGFRSMMRRRRCAAAPTLRSGLSSGPFGLDDKSGVHVGRALRAAIHGFVTLESVNGIGNEGTDESFRHMIELLSRGCAPHPDRLTFISRSLTWLAGRGRSPSLPAGSPVEGSPSLR